MTSDPLFRNIADPAARKRALAENAGLVIDEIICARGVDAVDLANKLNYVKRAIREMQDLDAA